MTDRLIPAEEYDVIEQMVADGELCRADGKSCEIVSRYENYGEDRDGNRGTLIEVRGCIKCGEES